MRRPAGGDHRVPADTHTVSCDASCAVDVPGRKQKAPLKRSASGPRAASHPRRPAPLSSPADSSAEGSHGPPASLEGVMQLNHAAMEALQQGRPEDCNAALTHALAVAEAEVRRLQTALQIALAAAAQPTAARRKRSTKSARSPASATALQQAHESWLLCYAVTLSNLGCKLRWDGRAEEALVCLRDARDVEVSVTAGGKPSCSTMMNLAAVLLSMGHVEEALPMAKDCVAAAQQGDRVLFITALHNLAVTLGQQPTARERSAALPTMLRALREAQDFLGDAHATTQVLKEKCATTHQWVLSDKPPQLSPPPMRTVAAPPMPPQSQAPHAFSLTGSLSSHATGSRMGSVKKPSVNLTPLAASDAATAEGDATRDAFSGPHGAAPAGLPITSRAIHEVPRSITPSNTSCSSNSRGGGGSGLNHVEADHVGRDVIPPLTGDQRNEAEVAALVGTTAYEDVAALHRRSSDGSASATAELPLIECAKCPSVDLALDVGSQNPSTTAAAGWEVCLTEKNSVLPDSAAELCSASSASGSRAHQVAGGAVLPKAGSHGRTWGGGRCVNIHASEQPSFLRFATVGDVQEATSQVPSNIYLTYQQVRARLRRQRDAIATTQTATLGSGAAHGSLKDGAAAAPSQAAIQDGHTRQQSHPFSAATGEGKLTRKADVLSPQRRLPLLSREQRHPTRQERLAAEQEEEEAYRLRKAIEDAAAREAAAFLTALGAIETRTRERAARRIQSAWVPWWQRVGKPRREAHLRRAEERERRLRERLAAMADVDQQQQHREKVKAAGIEKVGRFAAPVVVVRCGLQWLKKTAGVRYLRRHHLQRGGGTADPVGCATRRRFTEADVQRCVVRIQSLWRGALVRTRAAARRIDRDAVAPTLAEGTRRREEEEREYAALVLQKLFRCYQARQARRARFADRFTPPARTIQRWYRSILSDQQRRGVDGRTVRRRHAAAVVIQCAWRCFQARLRLFMEQIKREMRSLRLQEREAQRIACVQQQTVLLGARREEEARVSATAAAAAKERAEAEEAAMALRRAEEARGPGFTSAYSGKFYPDIRVDDCTPYKETCAARIFDVYRRQESEHDAFDVPLHSAPVAARARQEWADRIQLRPFVVAQRRAAEELRCEEELHALRSRRAAVKIQRTFRAWRHRRDNPNRDSALLQISRGRYQQACLARRAARLQHQREQRRGVAIFGDSVKASRDALQAARQELAAEGEGGRAHPDGPAPPFPHRPSPAGTTACIPSAPPSSAAAAAVVSRCGTPCDAPRSREERWAAEKALRSEEQHVASKYPRELAELRGDVFHSGYGKTDVNLD